jgi:hypothetical protein
MFYNPMSISRLQERFAGVDWLEFIQRSLPESLKIGNEEIVSIAVPHHLTNLLKLLENTDKRFEIKS